jgi:hypothetical protein
MTTTQRAITVDLAYLTALIECAFFVHMGRSRAGGPDIRDRELAFGVGTKDLPGTRRMPLLRPPGQSHRHMERRGR